MTFLAFAETIQLVPDGTLIFHIVIILLMVFVLNKTLFKPVNRVLDERERRTSGRSHEAREILHRIDENLARYERSLREARASGYRLLEQQRVVAMEMRQNRLNTVREEVSGLIEVEKNEIHAQVERAQMTLKNEAQQVAVSVSTQILGRSLSS